MITKQFVTTVLIFAFIVSLLIIISYSYLLNKKLDNLLDTSKGADDDISNEKDEIKIICL